MSLAGDIKVSEITKRPRLDTLEEMEKLGESQFGQGNDPVLSKDVKYERRDLIKKELKQQQNKLGLKEVSSNHV